MRDAAFRKVGEDRQPAAGPNEVVDVARIAVGILAVPLVVVHLCGLATFLLGIDPLGWNDELAFIALLAGAWGTVMASLAIWGRTKSGVRLFMLGPAFIASSR